MTVDMKGATSGEIERRNSAVVIVATADGGPLAVLRADEEATIRPLCGGARKSRIDAMSMNMRQPVVGDGGEQIGAMPSSAAERGSHCIAAEGNGISRATDFSSPVGRVSAKNVTSVALTDEGAFMRYPLFLNPAAIPLMVRWMP
jgi:hypothetical protein